MRASLLIPLSALFSVQSHHHRRRRHLPRSPLPPALPLFFLPSSTRYHHSPLIPPPSFLPLPPPPPLPPLPPPLGNQCALSFRGTQRHIDLAACARARGCTHTHTHTDQARRSSSIGMAKQPFFPPFLTDYLYVMLQEALFIHTHTRYWRHTLSFRFIHTHAHTLLPGCDAEKIRQTGRNASKGIARLNTFGIKLQPAAAY